MMEEEFPNGDESKKTIFVPSLMEIKWHKPELSFLHELPKVSPSLERIMKQDVSWSWTETSEHNTFFAKIMINFS